MNRQDVIETSLAHRLIHHAARSAPALLSERLEEEWLADLEARQGQMSRVLFGLGCCWATTVIAREHRALKVTAASAATGSSTMTAYAQHDWNFLSRRTTALILIAALHVGLIYAFAMGLVPRFREVLATPFQATVVQQPRNVQPPPPVTQVKLEQPPQLVIPDFQTNIDVPPETAISLPVLRIPPLPTGPANVEPSVKRVPAGLGKGFPTTDEFYPPGAIRMGEQGSAAVQVCVDQTGRLAKDPTLTQSSGFTRLDEGALKLAKAGSGHYRPATENGAAVSSCFGYRITFNIKN